MIMGDSQKKSRRNFIKLTAATTLVAGSTKAVSGARNIYPIQTNETKKTISPNDKIRIATIGIGGMGHGDTQTALRVPGVEFVAAADVYDGRLVRVKEVYGNQLFTTRDYREILSRPDIDAVIVSTPDHWHSQITIDAMNAGKDVYCEKPMVQSLNEAPSVIKTQQKTKRILQVGSQFVSSILYQKVKELLDSGAIGNLNMVEASINRRFPIAAWQYTIPPDASPQNIDWDRFLGNAPKRPFDPIRLFRWRNYWDYGTGIGGDLFVHLFSILHYVAGSTGPTAVTATGGLRYWKDERDVPDVLVGLYDYPKAGNREPFNVIFNVNFADGRVDAGQFDIWTVRFIGSEGVITVDRAVTLSRKPRPKEPGHTIGTFAKATQDSYLKEYNAKYPSSGNNQIRSSNDEVHVALSNYDPRLDHFTNFFEAMRTRKPVVEDGLFGFRAAAPALLTNQSYLEKRVIGWDPENLKVTKAST
jgi:predicted dehydrogenase